MQFTFLHNTITAEALSEVCARLKLDKKLHTLVIDYVEAAEYACAFDGARLSVSAPGKHYVFRALMHLARRKVRPFALTEDRAFEEHGIMLDCSRNAVPTCETVKKHIVTLAMLGYNTLQLYTEDTYEIDGEPYFGYQRGRFSKNDLKELDAYAQQFGISLIPCIQTLAHLNGIFRWPCYGEIRDVNDILLAGEERTYALIKKMFATVAECFTARTVNIGMDEAFLLGRGKYAEWHGTDIDRMKIFVAHLKRVAEIAAKYGFHCAMWSDMFYRIAFGSYYSKDHPPIQGGAFEGLPENVSLIYWDYYERQADQYEAILRQHEIFHREIWFAGGAWTWLGFLPFNRFSIDAAHASIEACKKSGVKKSFLTMWGDDGAECPYCGVLPTLVYAAEYAYGNTDDTEIKSAFKLLTGVSVEAFLLPEAADQIGNYLQAPFSDPTKYMLYSDCFAGLFDGAIEGADGAKFAELAAAIKPHERGEWAYFFTFARSLCEVLELKYAIGVKTRSCYKQGDKEGLKRLADHEYKQLVLRLNTFYRAFEHAWHTEKKQSGFEVHDARLGGLIQRVKHCRKMLLDYCSGKLEHISQLEEPQVSLFSEQSPKQTGYFNNYQHSVSVNFI